MNPSYHVTIVSRRHGRGDVTFFDEPFGEQTPFDRAGGFTIDYENGAREGGAISLEDLSLGLDSWLAMNHWMRSEDVDALVGV
jgi:hypothetical protein